MNLGILIMIYIGKGLCGSFYLGPSMLPDLNTCSLLQVWEFEPIISPNTFLITKFLSSSGIIIIGIIQILLCLILSLKFLKLFLYLFSLFAVLMGGFHYSNFQITSVSFSLLFIPASMFFILVTECSISDWVFFCIF